jgi:hypothetical protein
MKPDSQETFSPATSAAPGSAAQTGRKCPPRRPAQRLRQSRNTIARITPSAKESRTAESRGAVVQRDQRERQKGPEDQRVRKPRQRTFANDLGLAEHLPEEIPDAPAERKQVEIRIFFDLRIFLSTTPKRRQKSQPEAITIAAKRSFSTGRSAGVRQGWGEIRT